MTLEQIKARYMAYLDALLHPEKFPEVIADNFLAHDLPAWMTLLAFRKRVLKTLTGQDFEVLHLVAEGNLVFAQLRAKGTHEGEFSGIAPTGKLITFEIFDIVRFDDDGKAAERWSLVDWVSFYRQIGMTEIPQR